MSLIERAKNICFSPATEWTVIAAESTPPATLVTSYAAPLAAIGAVAGFIGGSVIGRTVPFVGTFRVGLVPGLVGAVFMFGLALLGIAILSVIINALAPTFGAQKDSVQALKLAVYSYTPAWIAGVLNIVPLLGVLALFAGLYGIYLMYLGLPRLMKCPLDKAAGYTVVVVVCAIVLSVVVGLVGATVTGVGMMATGGLAGSLGNRTASTSTGEVQVDKDSPLGKLQEFGKKLEESNKKMEAASKAGNQSGQVAAAVETLGTIFGGGKRVEPIRI